MTGTFTAIVGRLDEANTNDVAIAPGAFRPGAGVLVALLGHHLALPVGVGTLHEDGSDIVLRGRIDAHMRYGQIGLRLLCQLGDRAQWSILFHRMAWRYEMRDGRLVEIVGRCKPLECSPVRRAAARGTRTVQLNCGAWVANPAALPRLADSVQLSGAGGAPSPFPRS